MQVEQLIIPIADKISMLIYSSSTAPLYEKRDAYEHNESKWQLVEGNVYDFEIIELESDTNTWTIEGPENIFYINKRHRNRGQIKTGTFVGTISFYAKCINNEIGNKIPLKIEIQSLKTDYRTHYRHMLNDITSYYTDLVMQQGSPITQKFDIDNNTPQRTLYQKFAFVKSIIESPQFEDSIHKIISNPVRKWEEENTERRIESVKRLSRNTIRQIASRTNRLPIDSHIPGLKSLPRYVSTSQKTDTINNHENQFIKYVITSFFSFCNNISTKKNAKGQLEKEAITICSKLSEYLSSSFFKQISRPTHLNIGSPILQRKEGYREILQAWLMFDLAAKITWKGGDNVYEAGKKNIAALYEYWLFFKLIEIVRDVFNISFDSSDLISSDTDNICLHLRQGKNTIIRGKHNSGNRLLNVRLDYNRTFSKQEDKSKNGSWTISMRPDYTLSIWPGETEELNAEEDNTIVHIHFDAKYRLEKLLINDIKDRNIDKVLDEEKADREIDVYKRGDLLKMHAYKDAIRRTGGAYILYPGIQRKEDINSYEYIRGFHEIIPGLGAFCIAPGHEESQIKALKTFIIEVVEHLKNRISQREKIAAYSKMIHDGEPSGFYERFPERIQHGMFPDTTPILIGRIKSESESLWIEQNMKYVVCINEGEISLNLSLASAKYILLYNENTPKHPTLYKTDQNASPQVILPDTLLGTGFPMNETAPLYLCFNLNKEIEEELTSIEWNIENLVKNKPYTMNFIELFEKMNNDNSN